MGLLNLKDNYTEDSFSFSLEFILGHLLTNAHSLFTEDFNTIRNFFYKQITIEKNHGVLGGIGLLKKFEEVKKCENEFREIILPASVAITIHDDEIWQVLSGLSDKIKNAELKEIIDYIVKLKPLEKIYLKKDPILFLLILCDNIQDWGRPCVSEELRAKIEVADVRFKNIFYDKGKIILQLYFNNISDSRCTAYISYKTEIFEKLSKLLVSPDIPFKIEYWNNIDKKKTPYCFDIK